MAASRARSFMCRGGWSISWSERCEPDWVSGASQRPGPRSWGYHEAQADCLELSL